jgi:signal transduction histidine kinase/CheY-like chemotaxis protein
MIDIDKLQIEMHHRRFISKVLIAIGLPYIAYFMIMAYVEERYFVSIFLLFMLIAAIGNLFILFIRIGEKREYIAHRICGTSLILFFGIILLYTIVIEGNLSRTQYAYVFPIMVFFTVGIRQGLLWTFVFVCGLAFYLFFSDIKFMTLEEFRPRFLISLILICLIALLSEYLIRRNQQLSEQLKLEKNERKKIQEKKQIQGNQHRPQAQLQRSQNMKAIETLAGGLAHELNNIFSGLVSYPHVLLMEIPKDSPLRKPILTIQKSGEKAAAVVQDLLTLVGKEVSVTKSVNLNQIISDFFKCFEYEKLKSSHPNVHFETDLNTDLQSIFGSPEQLHKTVMNLFSNAVEGMPHGGKIFISTETRHIAGPIRGYGHVKAGDYVILRVSDTGVGMTSEDVERIFEPFYTKQVMGRSGAGLGMAVVWGIVRDHHGYIDVESTKGKGTTFTLYFPENKRELIADRTHFDSTNYLGKGESILVVDDMEEQREIACKILKKLGYSVKSVSSGEKAIEYLKDHSVDLLVLDMLMDPQMDGLETYKKILEFRPGQKAIIASGFSETERVQEVQRLGAGAYIRKPYVLKKIAIAVRAELDK